MINYDLNKIKTLIFDVDGVLSRQTITLSPDGDPQRTTNVRDGYAINMAIKTASKLLLLPVETLPPSKFGTKLLA